MLWLRAFAQRASTMQGLLAALLVVEFVPGDGNVLAACHDAILATGGALLDRAQQEGSTSPGTESLAQADALLLGRVTYEMMEAAWRPSAQAGV